MFKRIKRWFTENRFEVEFEEPIPIYLDPSEESLCDNAE